MAALPSPPLPPDPYIKRRASRSSSRPPLPQTANVETPHTRSRATSQAASYQSQPQPIRDAVTDAFHTSSVQNQIDPELVRVVTEQVMKNLQHTILSSNISAPPSTSTQSARNDAVPVDKSSQPRPPAPQRPNDALPPRYTPPPSPDKSRPIKSTVGNWSSSVVSSESGDDLQPLDAGKDSNSKTQSESKPISYSRNDSDPLRRSKSQRDSDKDAQSSRHQNTRIDHRSGHLPDSNGRDLNSNQSSANTRPQPKSAPIAVPEVEEPTTLEKVWGTLFDNGNPTVRLSQFLRGLAAHLINDYEPKGSLVVTPPKMLRFFSETRLSEENYPWDIVFTRMTNASLATMYRKLLCQHHFVQTADHELPSVPALTPRGFELFITTLIQAHPEEEFDRLSRAVMHMPISNADDKTERFPKELSRRLLPSKPNIQAEQRLVSSLNHESHLIQLKGAQNIPPPPKSAPPMHSTFPERERKPYSSTTQPNVFDDDDPDFIPTSIQIERERKPYSAKGEGTGKQYDADRDRERERDRNRPPPTAYRSDNSGVDSRSRAGSNLPTQSSFTSNSDPVNIPPNRQRKSFGQTSSVPPSSGGPNSFAKGAHRSSPPRYPQGWCEPTNVTDNAFPQYVSNMPRGPASGPRDSHSNDGEEERRYQNRRSNERATNTGASNDDASMGGRNYPIPPRQPPSINPGSDSIYSASTAPPVGSQHNSSTDHRRNTWIGTSPTGIPIGPGTDGYGSFCTPGHNASARPPSLPGYSAPPSGFGPPPPHQPSNSQQAEKR